MDKSRTESLIGSENVEKLKNKHITIVGVGGVGGYATVMLARAGIENITIIDFDEVAPSNVNRQIVAYQSTIGRKKVDVLKSMLLDINPNINVTVHDQKLTKKNIPSLITQTDIVIDAIDSVKDKLDLIEYCKKQGIYILSAMGAGNRYAIPEFELIDIYQTHDDGLAKKLRGELRKRGILSLDVVSSKFKAKKVEGVIGSISYYPAISGCYISAVVVNKIMEEKI